MMKTYPKDADPMDVLRTAVSSLDFYDKDGHGTDREHAMKSAIKLTDFALLKSHPFTGECPVNFDGQEFIFEFGAPGGTQRIATCEVEVDYGSPLFVAVAAALGPFVPLPVT